MKLRKRITAISLVFLIVISLLSDIPLSGTIIIQAANSVDVWGGDADTATGFGGGTGMEGDPYLITSGAELAYLRNQVNGGTNYSGTYFKLTRDIDLNNESWTPIGNNNAAANRFAGIFDGAGHCISGLKVTDAATTSSSVCGGLFGYIAASNAATVVVKNLGVKGAIQLPKLTSGTYYVGGLAGYVITGTITGCYADVTVSVAPETTVTVYAGGLVGNMSNGHLNFCYAMGNMDIYAGSSYVGGVVGYKNITNTYKSMGCVWNRLSTQTINGITREQGQGNGVANADITFALTEEQIKKCDMLNMFGAGNEVAWTTGDDGYPIPALDEDGNYDPNQNPYSDWKQGVFSGGEGSEIKPYTITEPGQLYVLSDQVNNGNAHDKEYIRLQGDMDLSAIKFNPIGCVPTNTGTSCGFSGNVDGNNHKITGLNISSSLSYNGLFGYVNASGVISRVSVKGNVTSNSVDSGSGTGLLAGYCAGTILYCHGTGNVSGVGNSGTNAGVGGLIGVFYQNSITGSSVRGSVTGGAGASVNAGGLIGQTQQGCVVKSCYTAEEIAAGAGATNVGGLIGKVSTATFVYGGYWNKDSEQIINETPRNNGEKKGVGSGTEEGAEAKTTAEEMKTVDFTDELNAALNGKAQRWYMDASVNEGYPYLELCQEQDLAGSVSISGSLVCGQMLQAETAELTPNGGKGSLTYQWDRDGDKIQGATASSYVLTAEDVGCVINVTVEAQYCTGEVLSSQTGTVVKASGVAAPAAPTAELVTDTTIQLKAEVGMQYRMGTDGEWGIDTLFTGLTPETEYTFYARKAATATHEASAASSVLTITTEGGAGIPAKPTPIAPIAPTLSGKSTTMITLNEITGAEYSMNGMDWQDSPVFETLVPGTTYRLYARYKETATHHASAVSQPLEVTLDKETQSAPNAPTMQTKTDTIIILNSTEGMQYRMGTAGQWVGNPTFTGLKPNTEYTFYARKSETATHNVSAASVALMVKTSAAAEEVKKPGKTNLTAKAAHTKAELSWERVSGADGYRIYRSDSKNGTYKIMKTVNALKYTDSGLKKGKTYYYKVCAYAAGKDQTVAGDDSNIVSAKVKNQHKITFDTNGGSKIKDKYVGDKKKLSTPKKPAKKGYTFVGWYMNKKLMKVYDFSTKVTKDTVLYAKWKANWKNAPDVESRAGKGCVMMIWPKVDDGVKYEISRTFGNKESVFTFVNSTKGRKIFFNTGLASGKTYYYKVRAYKVVNGKKVYGKYSKTVKVVPN